MTTMGRIQIMDAGQPLEERSCRLLRLRDGRLAAVWRGLAYPLEDGDRIDVSAPGIPPTECLPPDAPMAPAAPCPRWVLVEGAEEAWVLIAGSVTDRDAVASRLRAAGLTVLRSGPWLGDPADGLDPDWFVRIARPPDGQSVTALLEGVLGPRAAAGSGGAQATEDLRRRLVKNELDRVRTEVVALQAEVEHLRAGAAHASTLAERVASLEAELARARDALSREPTPSAGQPTAAAPAPRLSRRLQEEVATVLESLLPGVQLLRDSLLVASVEFRDRAGLYRALRELTETGGRLPAAWKKLRGTEEWWERHVSTGEDDSGRAYARAVRGGRAWEVLLSHKAEQQRDVEWLRRQRR